MTEKYNATPSRRNLGVLYAEESGRGLTHPFFVPILNAFKQEAEERDYDITFVHAPSDGGEEGLLRRCRELELDGVCLVCVDFAAPAIHRVIDSGMPCVTVDHMFKGVPAVLSDNETGVQRLVNYAISQGHKRVAFIHGHNNSIVTRTRIRQFYNTMSYHKLHVPQEYVREGRYDNVALTREIVEELLKLTERPTCILLPDDIAYLGAQDAARALGLDIPGDISFAGYDGIALIQTLRPAPTTIRQDTEKLGRTAAQLLVSVIDNPGSRKRMPAIFPVEFLEGGTIGRVE